MTIVAVYGTLRRGEGNWVHFLQESKYLGTFKVNGFTMVTNGGFPYVFHGDGDVTVELFEINDVTFRHLDRLEGYPVHYGREEIQVGEHTAWIYIGKSEWAHDLESVPTGDWMDYRPEHRRRYAYTD